LVAEKNKKLQLRDRMEGEDAGQLYVMNFTGIQKKRSGYIE